jgi:hypothetical protein
VKRRILELPDKAYVGLRTHLLSSDAGVEQAAFVVAEPFSERTGLRLEYLTWWPIPAEGYVHQSRYHIELADEIRASAIKKAHDLRASLIEFHSHPFAAWAEFSCSDRTGLEEFVPHVRWRLKGRPYAAVVMTPSNFDGLVWAMDDTTPELLNGISLGRQLLRPTGRSVTVWRRGNEY